MERADATGLGVAAVGHAALLAAIVYLMDRTPDIVPPQPSVEVSFVEDAGLVATAPSNEAPAPSGAPEAGPPEEAAPAPADPLPEPAPAPPPPLPQAQQQPQPRPAPRSPVPRPQPPQQRTATPPRPQPPQQRTVTPPRQQTQRQSGAANQRRTTGPLSAANLNLPPAEGNGRSNQPAAAVVSREVRASMDAAIRAALSPCRRQPLLIPPEARGLRVRVTVTYAASGRVLDTSDPEYTPANAFPNYRDPVHRAALKILRECPLTVLAETYPQYYAASRGWRRFVFRFPE